tara:strand:- start:3238 stop:3624 length:387 start_codon:yes stop_codon:yes gene_type:complete
MERLATFIVIALALSTIGVGLIYMGTNDPSWTYKWQEVFKDGLRISIGIYVPLTIPKWKILRDVCYIFSGWYICDLIFELGNFGVNEMDMPQVTTVETFLFWTLYFSVGLAFAVFTKTTTWQSIIKRF